jgi:hypothetical protein
VASTSRNCVWASLSIWLDNELTTKCKPSSATRCLGPNSHPASLLFSTYKKAENACLLSKGAALATITCPLYHIQPGPSLKEGEQYKLVWNFALMCSPIGHPVSYPQGDSMTQPPAAGQLSWIDAENSEAVNTLELMRWLRSQCSDKCKYLRLVWVVCSIMELRRKGN